MHVCANEQFPYVYKKSSNEWNNNTNMTIIILWNDDKKDEHTRTYSQPQEAAI